LDADCPKRIQAEGRRIAGSTQEGYTPTMRIKLRVAALLFALAVLGFWCFGGPNLGWTKTSVPRKQVDPVTELEVNIYEPRFVPGVDFLAAGLLAAGLLAAGSFFFRQAPGNPGAGSRQI
jgi:hypothetical protein